MLASGSLDTAGCPLAPVPAAGALASGQAALGASGGAPVLRLAHDAPGARVSAAGARSSNVLGHGNNPVTMSVAGSVPAAGALVSGQVAFGVSSGALELQLAQDASGIGVSAVGAGQLDVLLVGNSQESLRLAGSVPVAGGPAFGRVALRASKGRSPSELTPDASDAVAGASVAGTDRSDTRNIEALAASCKYIATVVANLSRGLPTLSPANQTA